MGRHREEFTRAGSIADVFIEKVAVHVALYQPPVRNVQEIRYLPRAMISIRRGAVDAPQSFTDRTLSSANFDMTAVRRDKNVNEALHLIMLKEK
jgi:hypothetical protein